MTSIAKIVVGILAAIGALYVGTMIFAWLVLDPCDRYWLVTLDSPDQQRTAAIQLQSCPDKPATELNVYIYQRDNPGVQHGATLAENPATTEIYLEWRGDRALVVRHPAALDITDWPPAIGDVNFRVEQLSAH